ncbi:MAG: hypothetical protein LBQ79_02840 [Deltaproteobacteria bacterium]|jgi:hypothetical protein|nr:hypothetical protein [Deltaproteobacteria bacterium]
MRLSSSNSLTELKPALPVMMPLALAAAFLTVALPAGSASCYDAWTVRRTSPDLAAARGETFEVKVPTGFNDYCTETERGCLFAFLEPRPNNYFYTQLRAYLYSDELLPEGVTVESLKEADGNLDSTAKTPHLTLKRLKCLGKGCTKCRGFGLNTGAFDAEDV